MAVVKYRWYEICIQLGIPHHKLKEFEKEDDSFAAAINYWLCGNVDDVPCNWGSVVQALKSPHVGETGLAKRIKGKYLNGEYFNDESKTILTYFT